CDSLSVLSCLPMPPRPPRSPLVPYTTLFRSLLERAGRPVDRGGGLLLGEAQHGSMCTVTSCSCRSRFSRSSTSSAKRDLQLHERSEEHTSELQSRVDLVCRLLLEKKKKWSYT